MIDATGQVKAYSGQGLVLGNTVAFIFVFGLFIGSIVAIGFWDLNDVWIPGLIFMGLWTASFLIAKEVIGRSDTLDEQDLHTDEHGREVQPGASTY